MKKILLFLLVLPFVSLSQFTVIADANFEQALIDLGHDSGIPDGQVSTANITGVTTLNLNSKFINDLTGIQDFTALTVLRLYDNQLTSLDVTQNTNLTILYCDLNQLTSLDVTQNTALIELTCAYNLLTSLDLSQNSSLTELACMNNLSLNCLNVKNGNNNNIIYFFVDDNPSLTCIDVDDVNYSSANWSFVPPGVIFSNNCNNTCSSSSVGIEDINNHKKELVRIVDLLGRETTKQPNTFLIYQYGDGTSKKIMTNQ
jgi:hypothetical protein